MHDVVVTRILIDGRGCGDGLVLRLFRGIGRLIGVLIVNAERSQH